MFVGVNFLSPQHNFQGKPVRVVRIVWYWVTKHVDNEPVKEWRLCVHLVYPDGREDFYPLEDAMKNGYLVRPDGVKG